LQNQLFPPLCQIASVIGCYRGAIYTTGHSSRRTFQNRQAQTDTTNQVLCSDSLQEAVKNSVENKINVAELSKNVEELCGHLALIKVERNRPLPWLESHISADSFFENKHGFPEWMLDTGVMTHRKNWVCRIYSNQNYEQRRGFKTIHSTGRGKGTIGSGGMLGESGGSTIAERFMVLKNKASKDRLKALTSSDQSDKLKSLVAEENVTNEEQQRLKIAFAEGYLASDPKTGKTNKFKLFAIFRDLLSIVVIIAILFSVMGGSFRVQIGNSNEVHPEEINVSFDDVKGIEEAKEELQEIVEFLRNPDKFTALGGKLPKGVLLVGPPGTGKTLLARAVAGEAGVPFFHAAGPEFDEILVGQGARRVRDLFSTAKLRAPCVVFIDEIDSVGSKRTNSVLHPYANQTINQLLAEMDGFRRNEGVVVLGATNRREDLDKALLRPGRFDVEITVPIPDLKGRKEILDLYMSKIKLGSDVDIDVMSRGTTGFTGADIENMVNQAAVRAAIEGSDAVGMKYLEWARDKVLMGPEKKSRIPDDEANMITAYHEGGHTLVAFFTKESHPLHKVTIIPRGHSLGHTSYIPEKERYHITKSQMLATLDTLMGGRAAEELVFGHDKITSGASSDLKQATALATHMVKEWGMSEKVGIRTFDDNPSSLVVVNEIGHTTTEAIDSEIKRILSESYDRAKAILKAHAKEHKMLAEALIKYETLDFDDIKSILQKKEEKKE